MKSVKNHFQLADMRIAEKKKDSEKEILDESRFVLELRVVVRVAARGRHRAACCAALEAVGYRFGGHQLLRAIVRG